jgi:hypothetical protein
MDYLSSAYIVNHDIPITTPSMIIIDDNMLRACICKINLIGPIRLWHHQKVNLIKLYFNGVGDF